MRNHEKGFSLIELLVVVAIILIIAGMAIPNLISSRIAANEASAVSSLRTLNSAATTYSTTYGNGFPPGLAALGAPPSGNASCNNAGLIDNVLSSGVKSGYTFTYAGLGSIPAAGANCSAPGFYNFTVNGDPVTRGITGKRSFFMDQSGVIRFNPAQSSTASDSPIN